ncbi:DNA cytosine methyltransferase, partial [Staphylococcus aureus]|uniref:DNA cytosine methyltransferase n=1 Tax=Staphylococcus aureus TaxID=1280 RepID=UPI0037DA40B3
MQNTFPKYFFLQNLHTLFKSPSTHRGTHFPLILSTLNHLPYNLQSPLINPPHYPNPQTPTTLFIFPYNQHLNYTKPIQQTPFHKIIYHNPFFPQPFPIQHYPNKNTLNTTHITHHILHISHNFTFQFYN